MKLEIEKAENGFIVNYSEINNDGQEVEKKEVYHFDFDECSFKDVLNLRDMIFSIFYVFNILQSDHDKYSLEIRITHGDEYQCKDENCKLCKK